MWPLDQLYIELGLGGLLWVIFLQAGSFEQKLSLSFVFRENATHELQNTHKHQCV